MTNGYEILAECRTYPQLVAALRERLISHTRASMDKIEAIAGISQGSLSKLTTMRRPRKTRAGNQGTPRSLGRMSLTPLLTTGGCMLLLVVDPTTIDAATLAAARQKIVLDRGKSDPHQNRLKDASGRMLPVSIRENRRNFGLYDNKDWSNQMQARRTLKLSPAKRKRIARTAAKARWAKLRRELATSCA